MTSKEKTMSVDINILILCLERLKSEPLYRNQRINTFEVKDEKLVIYFDESKKDWVSFKIKSIEKVSD